MTDTPTENLENTEVTPFTEGDREIAYRTDSNPTVEHAVGDNPTVEATDPTRSDSDEGPPALVSDSSASGRRDRGVARFTVRRQ